jgi:hypothetical protein
MENIVLATALAFGGGSSGFKSLRCTGDVACSANAMVS